MRRVVRELDDLVFDRRTVPRPDAADEIEAVERRTVQVVADERVRRGVRIDDPARQLRTGERRFARVRERQRRRARALLGHARDVDARAIDARRRPGFQAPQRKSQPRERAAQPDRRLLAVAPLVAHLIAAKRLAAEERARREHDVRRAQHAAVRKHHAAHRAVHHDEIVRHRAHDSEPALRGDRRRRDAHVGRLVGERAQRAHGRALRFVQEARVQRHAIRHAPHRAAEGVDLAHELALRAPSDRRVARERADAFGIAGDEQRLGAEPRRGERSLEAGMAAADDDHRGVVAAQHRTHRTPLIVTHARAARHARADARLTCRRRTARRSRRASLPSRLHR